MFAGIVQVTGRVVRRLRRGDRTLLSVGCAEWRGRPRPGDSVAVDGVCLTVTRVSGDRFEMDLGAETLARTTLGECRPGQVVNLETPLRAADPIGGHLVQGHVDGTGRVAALRPEPGGRRVVVEIPEAFHAYVVERGCVAVNGVSLTVTAVRNGGIEMFLIPYTLRETNLGGLRRGDRVNLEFDPLGKYVSRWLGETGRTPPARGPAGRGASGAGGGRRAAVRGSRNP
ncbi:MAG: riboflavin synthase [Acidobacteria bacterium]|nr:riboflavin synthase [Acidobacteriota bacterium]